MPNSILNAVKSQSWVVIPIIQDLEKEIRKERVHAIIRCATAKAYVNYCELKGFEEGSHPRVEQEFDNGFPVEREVINNTEETYGYNITGCEFAEYVRSIGELEISALMTSRVDCAAEEFISLKWNFYPRKPGCSAPRTAIFGGAKEH